MAPLGRPIGGLAYGPGCCALNDGREREREKEGEREREEIGREGGREGGRQTLTDRGKNDREREICPLSCAWRLVARRETYLARSGPPTCEPD